MNVRDIRNALASKYASGDFTADGMIEIVGASFVADEDAIFGEPNHNYISREIDWYLGAQTNIRAMTGPVPKIWESIAGPNGEINSNYGYLLFSPQNGDQLAYVMKELGRDKNSRRAVAIYQRPSMHTDFNKGGMNDFVCTNAVHYLCRNGRLDAVVQMRSNDAVYGYKNDYAWQRYVLRLLGSYVSIKPGTIYWQAASLHVYPKHHALIEKYAATGE